MGFPGGRNSLRAATGGIAALLLPRRCVLCGSTLFSVETGLCTGCDADLDRITCACPLCAAATPDGTAPGIPCPACQRAPPPFTASVAPFRYAFPLDAAIRAFKFRRRLEYAAAFGALLVDAVRKLPPDIDALQPVPLYRLRQLRRGYNQALEMARPVARATGLPIIKSARRIRHTPYQSGLEAAKRRSNLRGAFRVDGAVAARHVVLVDDVVTTGATCRALARRLLEAGVEKVSVLALARA
jgi:ComF family protein